MPVSKTASNKKTPKTSQKTTKEVASVEKKVVQKAGGKSKATKEVKKPVTKTQKVTKVETETKSEAEKSVRSFKVMLPGTENFVGRFTGLTPYQAANKALSKYYRETKKPKQDIQFSIRESTRGSKRSTYTYNGARLKLEEPVKYTISNQNGEDREIVKKFKNRLTKVKKSELSA